MELQLLIQLLEEGLENVGGESGQALIRTLERVGWSWSADVGDDDLIYSIQNRDGDTRYNRYDDSALSLWQQFTTGMQLMFKNMVSKQKRTQVGSARLIPFPDKRSPTPAA
jgi:hypothetical protein